MFLTMSMIKSTANTTVQTQSSDNNWDSVSGKEMPGETRSEAKHLIGPVWLHRVGWTTVRTYKPGKKIMI